MPGVPHVIGLDGAREAPRKRRDHQRKPGRCRAHEARSGREDEEGHELDRGGREDAPQGGNLASGGSSSGRRARAGRGTVKRVGPRSGGIHRRKQHLDGQHKRDDTEQNVRYRRQDPWAPLASASPGERESRNEDREPEIFLDKNQRSQPRHTHAPPPFNEGNAPERQQRHGHADLVKLRADRPLESPPQPVGEPDEERASSSEETLSQARDGQDRRGDQHVLDYEEGQRGREETKDGPQECQDRMKVVAEQVVARALDGSNGCFEARIRLDGLGEDAQIPGGGDERAPLRHRIADVECADKARDRSGQPPRRDQATDG